MNHRTQSELEITAILNQSVETRSRRNERIINSIFVRTRLTEIKSFPVDKTSTRKYKDHFQQPIRTSEYDFHVVTSWPRFFEICTLLYNGSREQIKTFVIIIIPQRRHDTHVCLT